MTPYLILVCLVAATGGFLFGFDTSVISGVIEYLEKPTVWNLGEIAKGWTVSCILIGCMIGSAIAGPVSNRYGRKATLSLVALVFLVSSLGCALTSEYQRFIIYRIVAGVAVGAASMIAPIYIAEISPARHRGKLVSFNLVAILLGQLVAYFSNYLLRDVGGDNNWRWMLGVMAAPSLVLFVLLFLVPESPRWLVERRRIPKALSILTRINGEQAAIEELRQIEEAAALEEKGRIGELLQPRMRWILTIGVAMAVFQQITGINVIMYYAPAIFKSAGSGMDSALLQTALIQMVYLSFAIASLFFVDKLGRKPLMVFGSLGTGIAMALLAWTFITGRTQGYFVIACIMFYLATFGLSLGPIPWVLIAEIFPNNLRSYAAAICTFALWGANFIVSLSFPWLLRTMEGYSFVIYGAMCFACVLFTMRYLKETKGRSLEEIERDLTAWRAVSSQVH